MPPATPATDPWAVRLDGIGPLRAGMTLAEAATALGGRLEALRDTMDGCGFTSIRGAPSGLSLMVVEGRVERVDVDSVDVATDRGARVGDAESRVLELYSGEIRVEPHPYEGPEGHNLVVAKPGDTTRVLIFETDGKRVTRYRAGRRPVAEWIEGCS